MKDLQKKILPLFYLFTVITFLIIPFKNYLHKWGISGSVLMIANLLFFVMSIVIFIMQQKALMNKNPHVFVRSILGSVMIKMLVCVLAIILYKICFGIYFSKISVFVAMFFYLFYLAVEVSILLKMNKQNNA